MTPPPTVRPPRPPTAPPDIARGTPTAAPTPVRESAAPVGT